MTKHWEVLKGLSRIVLTHEGHTIMCASAADARFCVESANALIDATHQDKQLPLEASVEDREARNVSPLALMPEQTRLRVAAGG